MDRLLRGGLTKCFNYSYYDGLNSNKMARSDFILIKDIFGTLALSTFCFNIFGSWHTEKNLLCYIVCRAWVWVGVLAIHKLTFLVLCGGLFNMDKPVYGIASVCPAVYLQTL